MKRILLVPLLGALLACKSSQAPQGCDPNPCTLPNRNVCVATTGEATCRCNDGYVSRPNGNCEAISIANCPEHSGDSAEPDDCAARAAKISSGDSRSQTIEPAGDYDFYRFDATDKEVYSASVQSSSSVVPRIDLFDGDAKWISSAEHVENARLAFRITGAGTYFLRVMHSPQDASVATGAYTLTFKDLGAEDYGDTPAEATVLTPNGPNDQLQGIEGTFLYPTDQDWFAVDVDVSHHYRIFFDDTEWVPPVAIYFSGNLNKPLVSTQQETVVDFSFTPEQLGNANQGRIYIQLSTTAIRPSYSFTLTSD